MGALIILFIAFIAGFIAIYFDNKFYSDILTIAGILLSLFTGVALLFLIPDVIVTHIKFDYIKEEYHNLELQINTIDYDDIVTGANLRNQVLEMNNKISEHKVYSKSILIGIWYSEEIGNLKPLEWKSKKNNLDKYDK